MKSSINFYQESLKPRHDPLPLALVVKIFIAAFVVLAVVIALQVWRNNHQQQQLQELTQQHSHLKAEVAELNKQLAQRRDTKNLQQQLEQQQRAEQHRLSLIAYLQGKGSGVPLSYSALMNDLARYHNPQVWLTEINISQRHVQLQGKTAVPSEIAPWLKQLRNSNYFLGKEFSVLEFDESDELRQFNVSTRIDGEQL
ncbi:PilN domain-containing protein [Pseudoalteromonas sp. CNC9-20]|uniref:PilN domain-containing protein n=1 Tax=Pseudoalteromonas sp. CNC9-20 TaxID=2917750 RepID=UPI001EF6BC00|nr:PilN domain-containing protein [Pseudoalteromonas sp. CNC9-20]MCG7570388.1 PilN domain-containing protein [Pseudoalteromonas sp. CNC9-20]